MSMKARASTASAKRTRGRIAKAAPPPCPPSRSSRSNEESSTAIASDATAERSERSNAWPSTPPRLGACGRLRGARVLGPEVAGIAAAKVGAHGGPGAAPKARQVARDLDRAVRGREQV